MKNTIYCPYCGNEMKLSQESALLSPFPYHYYMCTNCGAQSPAEQSEDDAYTSASKLSLKQSPVYLEDLKAPVYTKEQYEISISSESFSALQKAMENAIQYFIDHQKILIRM